MRHFDDFEDSAFIFGALMMVANKMGALLDKTLNRHGITATQWFLLLIIFNLFDKPPTIKEVAKDLGSSHQNVKQVAQKLESKGLLKLEKDKLDQRVTRLITTDKSQAFWLEVEVEGREFLQAFYRNIEPDHIHTSRQMIAKVLDNLKFMESPIPAEDNQVT
ncbi:MAG: MarR family transcriptional regulator [Eubacteriales bacterium]|nr:MarR family transcriptional regulator [Eubacteriales bacterium]